MNIFKSFLEALPYPVWIEDINTKILFLNKAYENLYNIKLTDTLGKTNKEVFPKEVSSLYNDQIRKCISEKKTLTFNGNVGNTFVECIMFPILNSNNEIYSIAGIILTINDKVKRQVELKKQKDILKTIIDSLPEAIFYKDKDCKFIGYNKNFSDFYANLGVYDLIGKSDLEIYPNKETAKKFMEQDKEIIRSKKAKSSQYSISYKDGDVRFEENLKVPVINEDGEVWGIVGLSRDITERKKLENKLRYLSYTDSLTGLYNRSSFEEKLNQYNQEKYLPLGIIMGDVNGLKLVNDTLGHLEGDKLIKSISNVLTEVCSNMGSVFRWGGDEFMILLPNCNEQLCENIMKEILDKCQHSDYEFIQLSIALGESVKNSISQNIYECIKEVEEKVYRRKLLDKKSIRSSITDSLIKSLQEKNTETEEHTERVTAYAYSMGLNLNFKASELDELFLVAKLHDIGKIGINEEILLKPGKLTNDEFIIMKTHSEKGYRILHAMGELENVAKCVLCHHEKWDGTGYPLGLKEDEIPLISRIISIVDAYDVMTSNRPYKKPMTKESAIAELMRCSGTQFDPFLVNIFINSVLNNN
ncbi:Cyclic di-GMP phosphodiesterase response regulator RpfG [uncultured Clostridium sp.]|uniref:sensor domain-containing diguanylate cyclase/phosphohydrolase n=1 Tax=uncultured Clostridium sp. TaxID=59620 RepID=UPI0008206920|nr:HD domain-containing phosphohydrolase [uncultured Clostridium sp.]SCJ47335.1 Cyclic di-GMP phosphodiesterase response regulator RpfG [uncultured Clostridium sp.]